MEAGIPTDEELDEIFSEDPELKKYPTWFNYGYQLNKIFKPTPVKTANDTTSVEDLDVNEEEDVPAPKAKSKYSAKPAPAPKVEADDDDFNVNLVEEDDLDLMLD